MINEVFEISLRLLYLSFPWHKMLFEMKSTFGSRLAYSGIIVLSTWLVMLVPISYPLKTCYVRHIFISILFLFMLVFCFCYLIDIHDFFIHYLVLILIVFH